MSSTLYLALAALAFVSARPFCGLVVAPVGEWFTGPVDSGSNATGGNATGTSPLGHTTAQTIAPNGMKRFTAGALGELT